MEMVKAKVLAARLTKRKRQIAVTQRHLASERNELERNEQWKDAWSRARRRSLLNYLERWYDREMSEINRALERVSNDNYGTCAMCRCNIEPEWLETFPEAEYCRNCQTIQERVERG